MPKTRDARRAKLKDDCRSQLYLSIGRALNAGLPAERALNAVTGVCGGALDQKLRLAANAVGKGTGIVVALDRQGLLSKLDHAILECAERVGAVDTSMLLLAKRYEARHYRGSRFKSKLVYPAFLFVFSIFCRPVPALFHGRITVNDYLSQAFGTLAAVAFAVYVLRFAVTSFNTHGWPRILSWFARRLPRLKKLVWLHERAEVNSNLALMFAAGMPAQEALRAYCGVEPPGVRRMHIANAAAALNDGEGVAAALRQAQVIDPLEGYAIVSVGESAGKLDENLERYGKNCRTYLDDELDMLVRLVPFIVYLYIVYIVLSGMFNAP